MYQNNTDDKKQTLKNFDDSMKLLLTESIKFFPVSSVNRIRRKYKALNILRKDGSLKYFMNELIPFQESVFNKDEKTFRIKNHYGRRSQNGSCMEMLRKLHKRNNVETSSSSILFGTSIFTTKKSCIIVMDTDKIIIFLMISLLLMNLNCRNKTKTKEKNKFKMFVINNEH